MAVRPILETQKQAGATVEEEHGRLVPKSNSSLDEEYEAATQDVGLVDRSHVGRLKVTGEDGLDLLDRLSTNKLTDLTTIGQGAYTVLTSSKGRILDLLFVLKQDDHLLLFTSPENRAKVAEWIDFYTFTEDVAVADVTEQTAMLGLTGPGAAGLLDEVTGLNASSLPPHHALTASIQGVDILAVRTDFVGLAGYDLVVTSAQAQQIWTELLGRGAGRGLKPVGADALEAVRIEQGTPIYGKELSEERNPLEANLRAHISFDKGCYIGQEVVARLDTYEKVQRHLVGLSWEGDAGPPPADSGLFLDGKRVGAITSSARSPRRAGAIGLGYVRKAQAKPGLRLTVGAPDGELVAQVEELPLRP